jgi:hypothetical protein
MVKLSALIWLSLLFCSTPCSSLMQPSYRRALAGTTTQTSQRHYNAFLQAQDESSDNDTSNIPRGGDSSISSFRTKAIIASVEKGYAERLAADPSFLSKSILEIMLAASTQYAAEVGRRGRQNILTEIDFVTPGILTAVCGKYYSMWRVAKTVTTEEGIRNDSDGNNSGSWRDAVPTNAFQPTLLDGRTKPTLYSRFLALILPMPELFRAGIIASTIGYGLTAVLVRLRAILIPEYVPSTVPVPVLGAGVYTGLFMAIVSNIRYQLLQGVIEPYLIEEPFRILELLAKKFTNRGGVIALLVKSLKVKGLVIALARWANGLLGSWISIGGMRACGLQKLKS